MIINDERKAKSIPFRDIKYGEMFIDEYGDYMMRTENVYVTNGVVRNAVDLVTGVMCTVMQDKSVIRINRAFITVQN